jgi:hypothetical protein
MIKRKYNSVDRRATKKQTLAPLQKHKEQQPATQHLQERL